MSKDVSHCITITWGDKNKSAVGNLEEEKKKKAGTFKLSTKSDKLIRLLWKHFTRQMLTFDILCSQNKYFKFIDSYSFKSLMAIDWKKIKYFLFMIKGCTFACFGLKTGGVSRIKGIQELSFSARSSIPICWHVCLSSLQLNFSSTDKQYTNMETCNVARAWILK